MAHLVKEEPVVKEKRGVAALAVVARALGAATTAVWLVPAVRTPVFPRCKDTDAGWRSVGTQ